MTISCRLAFLALLLFPWLTGCEEEEIAWLPDSSGMVYRDADKGFSRYDLASKKSTSILAAGDKLQGPHGLAVSPKSDQFALSKLTCDATGRTLEITVYGFDGKEALRTRPIQLSKSKAEFELNDSGLEWSTSGKLIVYHDQEVLGFFDLQSQSFTEVQGYHRFVERWTGSCAAPDGSGMLAKKISPDDDVLPNTAYFLDWQGKTKTIALPAPPAAVTAELNKENHCLAYYGVWVKGTLQHQVLDFRLDIDTKAGTAKWYSLPIQLAARIPARDPKFGYIAQPFGNGFYAYIGMDEDRSMLGIINPQTRVSKVLFKDIEIDGAQRSPDGKKLALNVTEKIKDQDKGKVKLVILDEQGNIAATLDRGEIELAPPPPPAENIPLPAAPAPLPPAPSK